MNISNLIRIHWAALRAVLVLTVITGLAYPASIWVIAQIPGLKDKADGSILTRDGATVGSALIGQSFTDAKGRVLTQYFQPRPSAAGANGYDPMASGASNLGPESIVDTAGKPSLLTQVCSRSYQVADVEGLGHGAGARPFCTSDGVGAVPGPRTEQPRVPADAVTAGASGLDPDISVAYAELQVARVAHARRIATDQLIALVRAHTTGRTLGFLGEPCVNVLRLNLALDQKYPLRP